MRTSRMPEISRHGMAGAWLRTTAGTRLAASPSTSRLRTTASIVLRSPRRAPASSPAVYSATRAHASTMSATYAASSRDTPSLGLDALAQPRLERCARHEIDFDPERVLEE